MARGTGVFIVSYTEGTVVEAATGAVLTRTCELCGAAIVIDPSVTTEERAIGRHSDWHAKLEVLVPGIHAHSKALDTPEA